MAQNGRVKCVLGRWAIEFGVFHAYTFNLWEQYLKAKVYRRLVAYRENNFENYVVPIDEFVSYVHLWHNSKGWFLGFDAVKYEADHGPDKLRAIEDFEYGGSVPPHHVYLGVIQDFFDSIREDTDNVNGTV